MIDMVKRDVDARLQAMISAERHRFRIREEARRNPVCRVNLRDKVEYVTLPSGRVLKIVNGRIYSFR